MLFNHSSGRHHHIENDVFSSSSTGIIIRIREVGFSIENPNRKKKKKQKIITMAIAVKCVGRSTSFSQSGKYNKRI